MSTNKQDPSVSGVSGQRDQEAFGHTLPVARRLRTWLRRRGSLRGQRASMCCHGMYIYIYYSYIVNILILIVIIISMICSIIYTQIIINILQAVMRLIMEILHDLI